MKKTKLTSMIAVMGGLTLATGACSGACSAATCAPAAEAAADETTATDCAAAACEAKPCAAVTPLATKDDKAAPQQLPRFPMPTCPALNAIENA